MISADHKGTNPNVHVGARKRVPSWMASTIILTNIGLATAALWSFLSFGSLGSALGYLAGNRLVPDNYNKSFGTIRSKDTTEVYFRLENYSKSPVTILGSNSTYTCVVTENLPLSIPALGHHSLKVKVAPRKTVGQRSEKLKLFTNLPQQPTLVLALSGKVVSSADDNALK